MKMTKEQMFDMKHTHTHKWFYSENTVIYSSAESKGHGNVTVFDRDTLLFFSCGFIHEG